LLSLGVNVISNVFVSLGGGRRLRASLSTATRPARTVLYAREEDLIAMADAEEEEEEEEEEKATGSSFDVEVAEPCLSS
jgi:hypothetical protein